MPSIRDLKKWIRLLLVHRLRTLLSTLGILFGVAAVIAMLSIGEGAKQETLEQIEQLGMNNIIIRQNSLSNERESHNQEKRQKELSWNDVEALAHQIQSIRQIAPMRVVPTSLSNTLQHFSPEIIAVNRSFGDLKQFKLSEGRFLCDLDQRERKRVCVLGYYTAKKLGRQGHLGGKIRLEDTSYEIVGVLKSNEWKESKNQIIAARNFDNVIFIPLESKIHSNPINKGLTEIVLLMDTTLPMDAQAKLVKHILDKNHSGYENYQIIIPQELLQQAKRTQKTFDWVLGSIAAVSLLVGGIGIMNIMLANVSERTHEIGIRRAVGASRRHILIQFLFEALFLTLIGAVSGIVFGAALSSIIASAAGWRTLVSPAAVIIALLMSVGIGLAAGLYPAYRAAMMDPIQALRYFK